MNLEQALHMAKSNLPPEYEVCVCTERGNMFVELRDYYHQPVDFPFEKFDTLAERVLKAMHHAIKLSLTAKKQQEGDSCFDGKPTC